MQTESSIQSIRACIDQADAAAAIDATLPPLSDAKLHLLSLLPELYLSDKLKGNSQEEWLVVAQYYYALNQMLVSSDAFNSWEAAAYQHAGGLVLPHSPVRRFAAYSIQAISAHRHPKRLINPLLESLKTYHQKHPDDVIRLKAATRRFLQLSLSSDRYLPATLAGLTLLQDLAARHGLLVLPKLELARQILFDKFKNHRKRSQYRQRIGPDAPRGHEFAVYFSVAPLPYPFPTHLSTESEAED